MFNTMVGDWYWMEAEALRRGGRVLESQRVLESGMADYAEHGMHRSRWRLGRALIRSARDLGDAALEARIVRESADSRELIARSLLSRGLRDAFLRDDRSPLPAPAAVPIA